MNSNQNNNNIIKNDYSKENNLNELNQIIGNVNKKLENLDDLLQNKKENMNDFKKFSSFNENKINFNVGNVINNNQMDIDSNEYSNNINSNCNYIKQTFNDEEIMLSINNKHNDIKKILFNRKNSLKRLAKFCIDTDINSTLNYLSIINDLSVYYDFINYSLLQTEIVKIPLKLDNARFLLTSIYDLINSKYENYKFVGVKSALVLLKLFSERIISTKGYPTFGIDLNKEERIKICDKIIEIYSNIRSINYIENMLNHKPNEEIHLLVRELVGEINLFMNALKKGC
jgi:hypothetical protein